MNRKLSPAQENEMVSLYLKPSPPLESSNAFGVSVHVLYDALRWRGIVARHSKQAIAVKRERAIALFKEYGVATRVSEATGYSLGAILKWVKGAGLSLKTPSQLKATLACDRHFFDSINTEAKAYWLGFIYADGSISKRDLKIGLHRKDRGHLVKFRDALGSEHKIVDTRGGGYSKETEASQVTVCSKEITDALRHLGVSERKSKEANPPLDNISAGLLKHFWRGVVDGDGSVWRDKTKNGRLVVSLCGTEWMCAGFRDFVRPLHPKAKADLVKSRMIYSITFSCGPGEAAAVELYGGSSVFLDRKRQTVREALGI